MVGVVIATEVLLYREGLAAVLAREPDVRVLGTAASAREVADQIQDLDPDVVLLDIGMPGGLHTAHASRATRTRLVALAVSDAATDLVEWARAGIAAYVSSDACLETLVETIHGVTRGESICSPKVTARILAGLASTPPEDDPTASADSRLTIREREIVDLLGRGKTNKEIAQALSIAVPTVKNHVHNILEKLHVRHRGDARSALDRTRAYVEAGHNS